MYCWNCGKEVNDNARFCTQCGTELRRAAPEPAPASPPRPAVPLNGETVSAASRTTQPAAPGTYQPAAPRTYEPAPEVKSAPKKKNRSWIVVVAIIAFLMIFGVIRQAREKSSGAADSPPSQTADLDALYDTLPAALEDLIKLHKEFVSDEGDGLRVFEIVFYGADTHTLTDITEEYVFDKSYGYTMEGIRAADFESDFPSFAETSYAEDDEHVMFICKMKDLKDVSHVQALLDSGFLSKPGGGRAEGALDADYYMDSVLALDGWESASALDFSLLDFKLD